LGGGHRQFEDEDADHNQKAAHLGRSQADEALTKVLFSVKVYRLRDGLSEGVG